MLYISMATSVVATEYMCTDSSPWRCLVEVRVYESLVVQGGHWNSRCLLVGAFVPGQRQSRWSPKRYDRPWSRLSRAPRCSTGSELLSGCFIRGCLERTLIRSCSFRTWAVILRSVCLKVCRFCSRLYVVMPSCLDVEIPVALSKTFCVDPRVKVRKSCVV